MRILFLLFFVFLTCSAGMAQPPKTKGVRLFDGRSFRGLEGDTVNTWRIRNGLLVGGSLTKEVPHNEFISTTGKYQNFILRFSFKLLGHEGFVNTGVQFHSRRIADPSYEMSGYQADLGDGYWGCLYDESRRNQVLAYADTAIVKQVLRRNQWNDYEVHSLNGRIRIKLNGKQTVDYTERDPSIPQAGLIAFQIHGGAKAEVSFKNIIIEELP